MTSHEISKQLQGLLDATGADRALTKYLFVLAKGYEKISGELVEALQAKSRSFFSMKQQDSQDRFSELRRQADNFPLGQIFHDVIELQQLLKTMAAAFGAGEAHFLRELGRHLASFYEVFEKLVRNPTKENFTDVLPEASHFYLVLVTARQIFTGMRQALQLEGVPRPDRVRLSLSFDSTRSFDAVVKKLGAVQTGYHELCRLAGQEPDEHPLEIVKLEASSLWICVEGEQTATSVLTSMIESFALFWYHRFASEDGRAAPSDRVSATQALVNLADELERAGIEGTSPDTQEVRDAALVMRRVLLDLLEGEPSLRVNDKPYAVDPAQRRQFMDVTERIGKEAAPAAPSAPQSLLARLHAMREAAGGVPAPAGSMRAAVGYEA